ncbi:hypothetical protein IQ255_09740 [Pleurocapsales cyanobacterium LEGE 10410]|nr:hypothetical protein [Pleurocapsales cyanobacterium LEGE 10410]
MVFLYSQVLNREKTDTVFRQKACRKVLLSERDRVPNHTQKGNAIATNKVFTLNIKAK